MAEKCICCGKKIRLLNGAHLNNQVCDNCFFPIDGYLHNIRESSSLQTVEENYEKLIQKLSTSLYSASGREYFIKVADSLVAENKNNIQTKNKIEDTIKNFKIATSYKFEGYKISKYFGITSGSTVLGTGFLSEVRAAVSDTFGIEADSFSDKLEQAKNSSVHKMINNAIQQGGNALIGVSFDYFTVASNMIGVVANGTVVEIEVSNGQIDND